MTQKRKDPDIFEGTFLEGLMNLDEKEFNEALPEVSEKDQVIGVLLPIEKKLFILASKRFFDYITLECALFTVVIRQKTPDEAVKHLSKMVLALQQFEVLRNLIAVSITGRINFEGGFISSSKEYKSDYYIRIAKGYKIVVNYIGRVKGAVQKPQKTNDEHKFGYFAGNAWEEYYFKGKNTKERCAWRKDIKALNNEIRRILYR